MKFLLGSATVSLILLTGCMSLPYRMQAAGAVSVVESKEPGYDYLVTSQNIRDIGVNFERAGDRKKFVKELLSKSCSDIEMVNEQVLKSYNPRNPADPAKTFVMKVRCIK